MRVDDRLYEAAVAQLEKSFPQGPGMATAAYTGTGRLLTGVRVDAVGDPACLCPETGPICEAARLEEPITAMITVARMEAGSRMVVNKPCGICMERLVYYVTPTAEIAVHDRFGPSGYQVRSFQELIHPHPGIPYIDDRHRTGMEEIAAPIRELVVTRGIELVNEGFVDLFLRALASPEGVSSWRLRSSQAPSPYSRWTTLHSIALRQIGWAFDTATTQIVDLFVDGEADRFRAMGCDEHDLSHLKSGNLGFINVFSNLLVFLETGERAAYELPFEPYDPALIDRGEPLHESVKRTVDGEPGAIADRELVDNLVEVLANRSAGGFVAYLRQRGLYSLPLFSDGTLHCPFARFSEEICGQVAEALPAALTRGLVRLRPFRDGERAAAREGDSGR